jgi:hypothetical protein
MGTLGDSWEGSGIVGNCWEGLPNVSVFFIIIIIETFSGLRQKASITLY